MLRELLRAIDEAYDDEAHWHPLADWLMDQNDPRGELIAIDLALENPVGADKRRELEGRRATILAESAPKLLGETFAKVVAEGYGSVTWRRGFVDEVAYVGTQNMRHLRAVGWLLDLMTAHHEPFSLLRKIDLSYTDFADAKKLLVFPHLTTVTITGTAVTDTKPLEALKRMKKLNR